MMAATPSRNAELRDETTRVDLAARRQSGTL
jgi:hypothetical protein